MGKMPEFSDTQEGRWFEANRQLWNEKTAHHLNSSFYDLPGFKAGQSSLRHIERDGVGEVQGQKLLHLQCHFGQDTLSWARLGAEATGVDLSDESIRVARELAEELALPARFLACDLYSLPRHLDEAGQYDLVFTSYGTIGWLPDLRRWAAVINHFLKPGGRFFMVEFHPVIWMHDDDFDKVAYSYFNTGPITQAPQGTYADPEAQMHAPQEVSWNHSLGEVLGSLTEQGLLIDHFSEYNYSTWPCFPRNRPVGEQRWVIESLGEQYPHLFAVGAKKR